MNACTPSDAVPRACADASPNHRAIANATPALHRIVVDALDCNPKTGRVGVEGGEAWAAARDAGRHIRGRYYET
jgi:hypothetical protein